MIDGHYLQLRAQLDELTRRQVVDDEVDKKRIADLREVTTLGPSLYLLTLCIADLREVNA